MDKNIPSKVENRVKLLQQFRVNARRWFDGDYRNEGQEELRKNINRDLIAVRQAVIDTGAMQLITVGPPPIVGGVVPQNIDPFRNFFIDFWGMSMVPRILDCVDQAIGVYQHMMENPELIRVREKEAIDIERALERAIRPAFRRSPPENERDVQDAVENVLNSIGIDFEREREVAPVGGKKFVPDFTVQELDLAVEVKLAKKGHGESAIQEELSADIAAYRTKWKHLLAVIYDLGEIADPWRLRIENQKHFGITVIVIKH
jgi:hypothetical protein